MTTTTGVGRSSALPRLTACLSLILTVLLSKHSSAERICKDITDTFEDTFGPALDLLAENLPSWSNGGGGCHPADLLAVFGHLHGIVRVLTIAAALGDKDAAIPRMFGSRAKSLFIMCNSLLKEHRNGMYTSGSFDETTAQRDFDSDSDDGRFTGRYTQSRPTRNSNHSDESDGLMDDAVREGTIAAPLDPGGRSVRRR